MNFCVIGLGQFGTYLARELADKGHRVLAIDREKPQSMEVEPFVDEVLVMDASEEKALRQIGLSDFDWVLITITEDLESSILIAMLARELGARRILVKAASELHARILEKIGVDRIVFPEKEMARRVAETLTRSGTFDFLDLAEGYRLVEQVAPRAFVGQTLRQLDIRKRFGVSVLAIRRKVPEMGQEGQIELREQVIVPTPDEEIVRGDVLILLGKTEDLEKVQRLG